MQVDKEHIKVIEIQKALKLNNINRLKHLGRTEGGFLRNSLRKICWKRLLKLDQVDLDKAGRAGIVNLMEYLATH